MPHARDGQRGILRSREADRRRTSPTAGAGTIARVRAETRGASETVSRAADRDPRPVIPSVTRVFVPQAPTPTKCRPGHGATAVLPDDAVRAAGRGPGTAARPRSSPPR